MFATELPQTKVFRYYAADPGQTMEFRLVYQGPLPAEKDKAKGPRGGTEGRAPDKHRLRKHFHLQLRELWKEHPDLKRQAEQRFIVYYTPPNQVSHPGPNVKQVVLASPEQQQRSKTWVEHLAENFQRCGGRFVPLINEAGGFTCSLDILFLRRDSPGNLIQYGGDIDNRIKVLLDGLRMPKDVSEMGGFPIDADEDPFFCLMEDDKYITSISVTTDRLIVPMKSDENINDVLLVIHVTVVNPSAIFAGNRLL